MKLQLQDQRAAVSICTTVGCKRAAGRNHLHCCTLCVWHKGHQHTSHCQERQTLVWVRDGRVDPDAAQANAAYQAAGVEGRTADGHMAADTHHISEANAVREMSDEDDGDSDTTPSRGQFLTRASSSNECPFIIEVSSEEDGEEADLTLILYSGGATATATGCVNGLSSDLDCVDNGSFSSLNTMD